MLGSRSAASVGVMNSSEQTCGCTYVSTEEYKCNTALEAIIFHKASWKHST